MSANAASAAAPVAPLTKISAASAESVELAKQLLAETREELSRADGKASILFAAATVVAGAIVTGIVAGSWSPTALHPFPQLLWWLGSALVAVGMWFLGSAVYPRVRDTPQRGRVTYFMDVIAHDDASLCDALIDQARDPLARTVHQLRALSPMVRQKYRDIAAALRLLAIGVTLTLVAALIG
jgi:hypothetical protein